MHFVVSSFNQAVLRQTRLTISFSKQNAGQSQIQSCACRSKYRVAKLYFKTEITMSCNYKRKTVFT